MTDLVSRKLYLDGSGYGGFSKASKRHAVKARSTQSDPAWLKVARAQNKHERRKRWRHYAATCLHPVLARSELGL